MVRIVCDLCGKDTQPEDVRYIDQYKMKLVDTPDGQQDVRVPTHKVIECCVACAEEVAGLIGNLAAENQGG